MSKNERRKNQPVEQGVEIEHPVTGGTPPAPDPSQTPIDADAHDDPTPFPGLEPDDIR